MEREDKREEAEMGNIHFEEDDENTADSSDDDDGEEFDFSFVPQFQEESGIDLADNIFANGQIRPVYPVFDRSLIVKEVLNLELMNISAGDGRMEKAEEESTPAPGSYCVWSPKLGAPPLDPSRKSRSTGGSSSKRWRLRDFVVGRSKSDGKHKFLFLVPSPKTDKERDKDKGETKETMVVVEKTKTKTKKKEKMTETNMVAAHRLYYAKDAGASGSDRKQKSYLPYRKNLVGFRPF